MAKSAYFTQVGSNIRTLIPIDKILKVEQIIYTDGGEGNVITLIDNQKIQIVESIELVRKEIENQ